MSASAPSTPSRLRSAAGPAPAPVPRPAPDARLTGENRPSRPAAAVLAAARRRGPSFRDELATSTDLSTATVNRQVSGLLDAGLVRERPDLVPPGAVGRPRIPVEVDPEVFGVLGMHLGVRRTTFALADLRGRVLRGVDVPTPDGSPDEVLTSLTRRLRAFGDRFPDRSILQLGVVVGGQLSADRGLLRHPTLGWSRVPVAEIVDRAATCDAVVVAQVEAMAKADLLRPGNAVRGRTLYVYARNAVDAVLMSEGGHDAGAISGGTAGSGTTGLGTISHLPVGGDEPCTCGATGCLESSAGDGAVADAAVRAGIVNEPSIARVIEAAESGNADAHELLVNRARLLGRGVALVRDMLDPDRVVLLGQAFTGYRPGLAHVSAAFAARSVLEPLPLQVSQLGQGVQALAACTAALVPVYADPLRAVTKFKARLRRVAPAPRRAAG